MAQICAHSKPTKAAKKYWEAEANSLLEVRKESLLKLIRDHEVEPWAVESLLVDIDGKLHAMTAEYKMQQEESNG